MKMRLVLSLLLILAFGALFVIDGCGTTCNGDGLGALSGDCCGSGGDSSSSSSGSSTGTSTGGDSSGSGLLYVADAQNNAILRFESATTLEGDVAPVAMIQGALTQLSAPQSLFLDVANDRLYVANTGQSSILVFDSVSTLEGNVPPTRFLQGTNTTMSGPTRTILDQGRDLLYVDNTGQRSILAFASGATIESDIAPTRKIDGANPGLNNALDMFLDSSADRLYVANTAVSNVLIFDQISSKDGNIFPTRTLKGGNTRIVSPQSVLVDSSNNLLIADTSSLLRFENASTLDGDVAPAAIITGGNTSLQSPGQMLLDSGNLYLANTGTAEILVFNSVATLEGNVFPDRKLGGANTKILRPAGIALDLSR